MIEDIIDALKQLGEESNMPKNVKSKIQETISILEEKNEQSINVNKALNALDEISDDPNLDTFIRTQIWNIVSLLEKTNH